MYKLAVVFMPEQIRNPQSAIRNRRAFAKLNLCLEIIGRREDNYHDITSVIQAIDLHDTLTFSPAQEGAITLHCDDANLASEGERNLVMKAARLLQKAAGVNEGAHITLHKGIPLSAGLGGGSSDAAATLVGLSDLWGLRIGKERLLELAAMLGSDVPFFLEGPTALVEGRGERVTRTPSPPPGWAVLVCPEYDIKDKTRRMYASLTRADLSEGIVTHRLLAALVAGAFPDSTLLYNAFERVADTIFDNLNATRATIMRASGRDAHLSGSGPTLYTLYPAAQESHARKLHASLQAAGLRTYLTQLITRFMDGGGRKT
jgi:4-diphosphocytidyl-2-C-methyl-D-erythritol kinase